MLGDIPVEPPTLGPRTYAAMEVWSLCRDQFWHDQWIRIKKQPGGKPSVEEINTREVLEFDSILSAVRAHPLSAGREWELLRDVLFVFGLMRGEAEEITVPEWLEKLEAEDPEGVWLEDLKRANGVLACMLE